MQNYFIEIFVRSRNVSIMAHFLRQAQKTMVMGMDAILPPRCPVSGDLVDAQGMISAEVWAGLEFVSAPYCGTCGIPFDFDTDAHEGQCLACLKTEPPYDSARAALRYNDTSRDMILGFKHGDKTHMVPSFMPWLKRAGQEMLANADFLIPVPLHPMRLLVRRYNQAGVIAHALSKETGIKHLPLALKRTRATASQGHLKTDERAKNVRKAFAVRKQYDSVLNDKNVILIDDVFTTGATVIECTKVLKRAGASRVDILTLARVVKD